MKKEDWVKKLDYQMLLEIRTEEKLWKNSIFKKVKK